MTNTHTNQKQADNIRRKILVTSWAAPLIYSVNLPVHAQTSNSLPPTLNDNFFNGALRTTLNANVLDNDLNLVAPVLVEHVSGEIPAGITLGVDGQLHGMTALGGTFVSTYQVTDATGFVGTAELTITIQ